MFKKLIESERKKKEEWIKLSLPLANKDFMVFESFKPVIVEDDSDTITEALGISEERRSVLEDIVLRNSRIKKISHWMCKCAEDAVHPNEVAFLIYQIGFQMGSNKK